MEIANGGSNLTNPFSMPLAIEYCAA